METQKLKLYSRTYRPLVYPLDGSPIHEGSTKERFGAWLWGIEVVRFLNGSPVTLVWLQDGTEEPLSELVVIYEPGKEGWKDLEVTSGRMMYARNFREFPTGSWMTGTEFLRSANGRQLTMVKLQDGTEEPLSELVAIPDRRAKDRVPRPLAF